MSTSMTCVVIIIALFYIWKTVNCQYYDYDYHEENEPKEEEEERHWEWDGQTDWRPESMKPQILDNFFNPFIEIQVEKEHNCTNVNCQRFYQPVCDSHGTIYKNPCWFNFHQCQKRGQGIYLMVAPCGYKQNEIVQHDDGASDCDKDGVLAEILSKLAVIRDGLEQKQAALASQSYSDDAIIVMSNIRSVTGKRSKNEIEFEGKLKNRRINQTEAIQGSDLVTVDYQLKLNLSPSSHSQLYTFQPVLQTRTLKPTVETHLNINFKMH